MGLEWSRNVSQPSWIGGGSNLWARCGKRTKQGSWSGPRLNPQN